MSSTNPMRFEKSCGRDPMDLPSWKKILRTYILIQSVPFNIKLFLICEREKYACIYRRLPQYEYCDKNDETNLVSSL